MGFRERERERDLIVDNMFTSNTTLYRFTIVVVHGLLKLQ